MNKNYSGLFVMLGLAIMGLCTVLAVGRLKSYDRVVSVKGLCEKEVKADKVIWPIAYKIAGNDLPSLVKEVEVKNAVILDFLHNAGIIDAEISFSAPKIADNRTYAYNDNHVYDYVMTSVVTVCTGNVDLVASLEGKTLSLVEKGISLAADEWQYPTVYSFNALNDIKPEMIEQATSNARESAQKFAKDSHSKLGKIKTASQGQFSIEDRDANTPYIKNVRVVTSVVYYIKG